MNQLNSNNTMKESINLSFSDQVYNHSDPDNRHYLKKYLN